MNFPKTNKYVIFMAMISIILCYIVFKMIDYEYKAEYFVELFTNQTNTSNNSNSNNNNNSNNNSNSNNVDMPLNNNSNTNSCTNLCGPNSRCATTGQQCLTDFDCSGCQSQSSSSSPKSTDIIGNDDAGKLTVGVTPDYSPLTSGFGTKELIITDDMYGKPVQANFGVNTWTDNFNESQLLFNKRYKPNQSQYMPNYQQMYSVTGEFIENGPLASNY
jgi:hypothetical protein